MTGRAARDGDDLVLTLSSLAEWETGILEPEGGAPAIP